MSRGEGGGRPREHDRDAIAEALVEWAQKDDSINLNKFCALNLLPPSYMTIWASQCPKFHKAYELAKAFLGARREEKLNSEELHVKAYDLNAKTYDYFLNEQVQKTAQFESNLREKEAGTPRTNLTVMVSNDLASGSNIPAQGLSEENN